MESEASSACRLLPLSGFPFPGDNACKKMGKGKRLNAKSGKKPNITSCRL
jgi:hypothetical protein